MPELHEHPCPLPRDWPIDELCIERAQVIDRIFVPHPPAWEVIAMAHAGGPGQLPPETPEFEQLFVPADDPWPRFAIRHLPRAACEVTEQQFLAGRRYTECYARVRGVTLGVAQVVATAFGHAETCARAACRRAGRCKGRRGEWDFATWPGPEWPPCATLENMHRLRTATERCLDALDAAIEARLSAHLGEPLSVVDHVGLTRLPPVDDILGRGGASFPVAGAGGD